MKAKMISKSKLVVHGKEEQRVEILEKLEPDVWYEITHIDQYSWYTDVFLEGFENAFNSVQLEYDDEELFEIECAESFQNYYRNS